jgi:5-methylcytosine-specific restriction enzyme B
MMEMEKIKELFDLFLKEYDEESKKRIWRDQSSQFQRFWDERIMSQRSIDLTDEEIDLIIRILDSHGKGNTRDSEAVAGVMIPQGAWRKMFRRLQKDNQVSEIIDRILKTKSAEESQILIDKLYALNKGESKIMNLTGDSGNAIDCLLAAYDPFNNLSIVSLKDRNKLIKSLGIEYTPPSDSVGTQINKTSTLIKSKFKDGSLTDNARTISDFAYHSEFTKIWKPEDGDIKEPQKKKYWLYAPGEDAKMWEEFYREGVMGLGWEALGDLNNYKSKKEIVSKLQKIQGTSSSKMNDATANYEFKEVISIGDIVIAKKGRGELLGYGEVTSAYYFDNTKSHYQKFRKVNWLKKGNWKTDHSLALKTLTNITDYPTDHPNFKYYYETLMNLMVDAAVSFPEYPLNTIFYGPPGTGKTYNTIIRAAQIVEERIIEDYSDAQRIFNEKLGDQIEFITFHQNYSYEDFIQGLRPDLENESELRFERKDGVFKRIADKALKNLRDSQQPSEARREFKSVFTEFVSPLHDGETEELEVPMKKVSFYINSIGNKSIEFRKNKGDSKHTLSIDTLRKMYEQGKNDLIIGGLQPYYNSILSLLMEKGKNNNVETKFKNYVIVIDEINRANISRVFGELITLIEVDKRSNGNIPLRSTLPSGEEFIVPSNLYIIGTMNTADKSIALLDIALRRRFEFEPMYPLYKIESFPIFDVDVLEKINRRIKELKGHDFQIGHSFFMDSKSTLIERMNKKVIPLLCEYFMNDEKEVKGILSYAGLSVEQDSWPIKINGRL